MDKLRALTAYLIDRQLVPAEQLDSFAEQVSLTLVWKPEREGLRLGDMRYRAVIILERLADHPARLMALVGSWLENNDQDRDGLPDPVFDVSKWTRIWRTWNWPWSSSSRSTWPRIPPAKSKRSASAGRSCRSTFGWPSMAR